MNEGTSLDLGAMAYRSTEELIGVNPVTVRRRVDFGECDPVGIVYTPRFADYLLGAFHWFTTALFHDVGRNAMPEAMPMRGLELDFRRMLFPGDWFYMHVYVTAIRSRSFDLSIVAKDEKDRITFIGRLSPITVDRQTNDAVPLPPTLLEKLHNYSAHNAVPENAAISRG